MNARSIIAVPSLTAVSIGSSSQGSRLRPRRQPTGAGLSRPLRNVTEIDEAQTGIKNVSYKTTLEDGGIATRERVRFTSPTSSDARVT